MATFIDDQGGTGWAPGSHTYFRLAAAWLPTPNVVAFQEAVKNLRKKLGRRKNYEFKFNKTHDYPEWRTEFYNLAKKHGLRFTACGFNKKQIRPGSVDSFVFHQGCAIVLATHLRETYEEAEVARYQTRATKGRIVEPVVVDDNKDPKMLEAISVAFRDLRSRRTGAVLTNKAEFRDSRIDEAVQLADMVMGAVGAHLDGDGTWYDEICRGGTDLGVVELCQNHRNSIDLSENKLGRAI